MNTVDAPASSPFIVSSIGSASRLRRKGFVSSRSQPSCYAGHPVTLPSLKGSTGGVLVECSCAESANCRERMMVFHARNATHFAIDLTSDEAASLETRVVSFEEISKMFDLSMPEDLYAKS